MKNATVQDTKSPSNATKVVTFKGKTANETKQIALNQTNIDMKAREILANTKIHVNDTKVNMEAQKLNKRMEMANIEREKAEKLKADMDHIEKDAERAAVEKVPFASHAQTQKRSGDFTLAPENAHLSVQERKNLLEKQKAENDEQIEHLREMHSQNKAKLHAQQEEK